MKIGETIYLGDGAYLNFDGYYFHFLANDHEHPTDRVSVEVQDAKRLIEALKETIEAEG